MIGGLDAPLDLRWVVVGLVAAGVVVAWVAVWVDRRLGRDSRLRGVGARAEVWEGVERAPVGVMIVERGGGLRFRVVNAEARRLLGMVGGGDWRGALVEDLEGMGAGGRLRDLELGEGVVLRWWLWPMGELALVLVFDRSERVVAERSGRRLLGELSHELRTPLATLMTHLEVQAAGELPAEARAASLDLARAEARRMSRLVQDMLALGRMEAGLGLEMRRVDVVGLVEEVLSEVRPMAEASGARMGLEAEAGLRPVWGDPDALRRVLRNLVENGLRHGGDAPTVRVVLEREAGGLRCAVVDDGGGIPAEHLSRVRERFYRVDERAGVEGSGLGLALVVETLRRHGAGLDLESPVPGRGAGTRAAFVLKEAEG